MLSWAGRSRWCAPLFGGKMFRCFFRSFVQGDGRAICLFARVWLWRVLGAHPSEAYPAVSGVHVLLRGV
eukprot:7141873-Pyramimonas_sp.AAC.1